MATEESQFFLGQNYIFPLVLIFLVAISVAIYFQKIENNFKKISEANALSIVLLTTLGTTEQHDLSHIRCLDEKSGEVYSGFDLHKLTRIEFLKCNILYAFDPKTGTRVTNLRIWLFLRALPTEILRSYCLNGAHILELLTVKIFLSKENIEKKHPTQTLSNSMNATYKDLSSKNRVLFLSTEVTQALDGYTPSADILPDLLDELSRLDPNSLPAIRKTLQTLLPLSKFNLGI